MADIDSDNPLMSLQAASCSYRIALWPCAGQAVVSLRTVAGENHGCPVPLRTGSACMPGCTVAPIGENSWNAYAVTSPALRSPTNGSYGVNRQSATGREYAFVVMESCRST